MQDVIAGFGDYGRLIADVWNTGVLGISIGNILVALAIFGFFYVLRGLFTRFVMRLVDRWVESSETHIDNYMRDAVRNPMRFLFLALGFFFATEYLALDGGFEVIVENLNRSLIVVAIFWILYNCIKPLSEGFRRLERLLTPEITDWLITGARTAVVLVAAATILQTWGIQVAPIIAGLGLFGVAVALGAQDLFKNLIGGVSVLVERRFGMGDWILVDGVVEGFVEKIGFRSTLVRRFDKAPVHVPNQKLADNAVTNFSAMTYRRISWMIGVEYRTTVDQLRRIRDGIEDYIANNDAFVKPPLAARLVRIDSFGDSSIDIMIYCFTHTIVWSEWLEVKEELATTIKTIVEEAGTGFAFPSRSIYVETVPPMPEAIAATRGAAGG